jgi:hypothetical protein
MSCRINAVHRHGDRIQIHALYGCQDLENHAEHELLPNGRNGCEGYHVSTWDHMSSLDGMTYAEKLAYCKEKIDAACAPKEFENLRISG